MGTSHRAVQLSGPRSSIISEKSSSSTTTMGKGNNEGGFSQEQIDMYKECFKLMDVDKDGTLSKNDLRAAFDNVGKLIDESELDSMLGEVGGSCTFDAMVKMFQEKMAGGTNDPDDLIVRAFKAYEVVKEEDGKKAIEAEMFRHALTHFGDVFNKAEVDDVFNEFEVDDDGYIESKVVIGLFVAGGGEEKKEEEEGRQVNFEYSTLPTTTIHHHQLLHDYTQLNIVYVFTILYKMFYATSKNIIVYLL